MDLKSLALQPSGLAPGHRTCAGCGIPPIVRTVLRAIDGPKIVVNATGCLEVTTTIYPYSSWEVPYFHSVFGNAAASASGIDTALTFLEKKGLLPKGGKPKIIVFAGDGGTYDIGLQALSGALERGHEFLYICYDNSAYMNTGVQRSSATPKYAETTTTPLGSASIGKLEWRKPLTEIVVAHRLPYVAQASLSHLLDLATKVEEANSIRGPKFINVLQPCPTGWGFDSSQTFTLAKLAVETRFWPLYKVELIEDQLKWSITAPVANPKPVRDFLEGQSRFKHLFVPRNSQLLPELQSQVDRRWRELEQRSRSF